jgi:hypothetical protein
MAIVPLRNLGQYGVITDVDPLDLPLSAFSYATNVRFTNNRITRSPVFTEVGTSTSNSSPRWAFSYRLTGATATYLTCNQNGTVGTLTIGTPGSSLTYDDISIAAYSPSTQALNYTTTLLSNVVYVNRSDRVPWRMTPADSDLSALGGEWDSGWRCKALRSFNNSLVAVNVTKGSTAYPTMVKVSDFAVFGTAATTWVSTTSNSCFENVLADLEEPLVDGYVLKDRFMLYSANETWVMQATSDDLIYKIDRLYGNWGVISQNCIAEVNNFHFVFGDNDLWMHDGYTAKSIATGRVREYIFNNMIRDESYQFFVYNNTRLNEIMFCYISSDEYCAFAAGASPSGCNKAAVYNWVNDTWSFVDLPYITGGAMGETYSGVTYADLTGTTYNTISSTYQGIDDATRLYSLMLGRGGTVATAVLPLQTTGTWSTSALHLYTYELWDGAGGAGTMVEVTNAPSYMESLQTDLDELAKELVAYKVITAIYPEGRIANTAYPLYFYMGASDYTGEDISWADYQTFDGSTLYKLDFLQPGRFLSMKIAIGNPVQAFTLSGMDIDFKLLGHR